MKKLTNIVSLNKVFGDIIVEQTGLKRDHVINAKSLYGGTMEKNESATVTVSFDHDESFVIFSLDADVSEDTMVEERSDNALDVVDSYRFTIMCYGKQKDFFSQQLKARLLTQELICQLEEEGVHIQFIEANGEVSDFINGHLVQRRDVIIHFSCKLDVNKHTSFDEMTSPNEVLDTTIV